VQAFLAPALRPSAVVDRRKHLDLEGGAILLYLGNRRDALMPADPLGRCVDVEWLFAALNSVEMASLPWSIFGVLWRYW
jgi:hypothetical protein